MHSNFSEKIVLFFMRCVMHFAALEILDSMGINESRLKKIAWTTVSHLFVNNPELLRCNGSGYFSSICRNLCNSTEPLVLQ